jgi:hypothetical protein
MTRSWFWLRRNFLFTTITNKTKVFWKKNCQEFHTFYWIWIVYNICYCLSQDMFWLWRITQMCTTLLNICLAWILLRTAMIHELILGLWTCKYSETSIYCSQIIRFPGSVVQFLWSLSESYLNYGSCIYCFPRSIVSFSNPRWKRWIEVSLYFVS